jgi:hypothetical protein
MQLNAANAEIHRLEQLLELGKEVAAENTRLRAQLNTPELHDFAKAVVLEAAHQRERWPSEHDTGKEQEDWFWLLGWLAGKAVHAARMGESDKALHHVITTAAVCANWHAAIDGSNRTMRPGIEPPLSP